MYHYLWWIPTIIIYYIIYSWLSKVNNDNSLIHDIVWYKDTSLLGMYIYGAICPWWVIISRVSKNILFDGMLYDNIMFLTYAFTMIALGSGSKFTIHQWIGVGIIIIGSVLVRI